MDGVRPTMHRTSSQLMLCCMLLKLQTLLDQPAAAFGGRSATTCVDSVNDFHVQSQHLHIDEIERRLQELEHEADKIDLPNIDQDLNHVELRVRRQEKRPCEDNELVCGGLNHQCVHHLLVCDGHTDCYNGQDETAKLCSAQLFRAGSTFRGMVSPGNRSFDTHKFYKIHMNIIILSAQRSPFFTPQTVLRVTLQRFRVLLIKGIEYVGLAQDTTWNGRYNHAKQQLTITRELVGKLPYVIVCDVHPNDDDRLVCTTHTEASLDVVERGIYIRV